ncbi:MAG: LysM peptidoglycan-binding domain-containing M23 family metallopeptidase [Hyphomicrobiales bacterium]|nr:LysM peptidoglycan-binding domain-containing M23 family metallopeptidase [Hyphomicrobiales bacterium]
MLALAGLGGCASSRFDGYGFDGGYAYASTGSVDREGYNGGYPESYGGGYSPVVSRSELPPIGSYNAGGVAYARSDEGRPSDHKRPPEVKVADGYGYLNGRFPRDGGGYNGYGAGHESGYGAPPPREAYPAPVEGGRSVVVAPGDTLYGLALRYGVSVRELEEANGVSGRSLRAGQTVVIPSPGDGGAYPSEPAPYGARRSDGDAESYDAGAAYSSSRTGSRPGEETCANCYTVKAGDSLFSIGQRFGMGPAPIAHHNKIGPGDSLRPGQVIMIPSDERGGRDRTGALRADGAPPRFAGEPPRPYPPYRREAALDRDRPSDAAPRSATPPRDFAPRDARPRDADPAGRKPPVAEKPASPPAKPEDKVAVREPEKPAAPPALDKPAVGDCEDLLASPPPRSADTFRQPVEGLVIAKFGKKDDGTINDGVNYSVPKGTPVKAAENGVVAYVGTEITGFGNLILIRHAGDFVTAYAHNDEALVKRCDIVKRGQVVAKAGATGNVSKPQLHFELRKNSKPVNPEEFFTAGKEP